jgi:hypothetical protein
MRRAGVGKLRISAGGALCATSLIWNEGLPSGWICWGLLLRPFGAYLSMRLPGGRLLRAWRIGGVSAREIQEAS